VVGRHLCATHEASRRSPRGSHLAEANPRLRKAFRWND
jgi:hypothetical protein